MFSFLLKDLISEFYYQLLNSDYKIILCKNEMKKLMSHPELYRSIARFQFSDYLDIEWNEEINESSRTL